MKWFKRDLRVIQLVWSAVQMLFICGFATVLANMTGSCKQPGKVEAKSWWDFFWVVMEKLNGPNAPLQSLPRRMCRQGSSFA